MQASPASANKLSIARLREEFDGRVVAPGDPDYDHARMPYYGGVDRHPAVIIRPIDAAAVARIVILARATAAWSWPLAAAATAPPGTASTTAGSWSP